MGRRTGNLVCPAVVWRRSDFRESSRIVTLLSRDHGRLTALAKGAHRPDSVFLGRLDFLNEVQATVAPDRGGLRLLVRVVLVRERRALREPARFVAANHMADLIDRALPDPTPQPAVFDLLLGGLNLLERCPQAALPTVVLGLELRYLEQLGALPDLNHCSHCGAHLGDQAFLAGDGPGLVCRRHATAGRQALGSTSLALLRDLQRRRGHEWPRAAVHPLPPQATRLPATWLAAAAELRPRWRGLVFTAADEAR